MLPAVPDVVIAPGVPASVRYGMVIAEVNLLSATAGLFARAVLSQQELASELDQWFVVICNNIGGCVGLVPRIRNEAAGADHVDRGFGIRHDAAFVHAES